MQLVKAFFFCLILALTSAVGHAQVTGLYAFGPFDSPGIDTINRGNLNIHLSIPIFSKPGRGGSNFAYSLNYEGLVWAPQSSTGTKGWTPAPGWGWTDVTNAQWGYVTYSERLASCTLPPKGLQEFYSSYSNYIYHDNKGDSHPITYSFTNTCGNTAGPTGTGTYTLTDNSGYTIYRTSNSFVAFTKDGAQFSVPTYLSFNGYNEQITPGAARFTDTNGNQISATSSGTFTDTMGMTALSVSGSAPSPVVYTYTDPNGKSQTVTVNYGTYTVQTAFGVSGITEYSQTSVPLVSSIVYSGDGSSYSFTYETTPGNASAVTGRIASITLRTGGTISYAYTGGSNGIESDGTTAGLTRTTSDGPTTYTRSGISSTQSSTTITDPLGNAATSSFLINSGGFFYETDHALYSGGASGTPLAEVKTCYSVTSSGCPTDSVSSAFAEVFITTYQNGVLIDIDTQTYTGPELLAQDQNSSTGITTTYAYKTYTGPYSIPFYRLASVISSAASNYQETTYGYDETTPTTTSGLPQHVAVTTQRGNLTSTHQWINSSGAALSVTNTYDDAGTVLTSTGPTGATTYGHDATDTFTTSVTPPTPSSGVTLTTTATYDANTGLLTSTTDPNGTKTTYQYNGMLQPFEVDTLGSGGNQIGKSTYSYSPTQTGVYNYQSASIHTDTETLYDAYGRQSRIAIANGQGSNPWYQQDTCYDADGRVNFQSNRYQGNGWATTQVCSSNGDSYTNDALGRVIAVTHADSTSTHYAYQGHATQFTDENGVSRIAQVDGLGRPTAVCELSGNSLQSDSPGACGLDIGGTGYLTKYSYDLVNHKTTVTQGSQTRSFQTDWMGRQISVTEPEFSAPTTYSYAYNGTGLSVTRQRPMANQSNASTLTTTTTQYDAVGRVLSIGYSDGTPTKSFSYDQASIWGSTGVSTGAGKGRLTAASVPTTSNYTAEAYQYDAIGRVTGNLQCLPSTCGISPDKWTYYSYDWLGNVLTATDGAGVTASYGYSVANETTSISSSANDATHPPSLVSNVQYGANGPLSYQLGNGLDTSFSYDSLGRRNGGWVCKGSTANGCSGGTQLYGYVATWQGVRNLGACDTSLNRCEGFGYDEFNRITSQSVNTGTAQNFSYVYDRYGNRWNQNVTAGSGPSPSLSFNTTTNRVNSAGYQYDAAGNLTSDGAHSYVYDAEGNVVQVDGGSTAKYTYNALNQRVRIDQNGGANEFVFNLNGQRVSYWDPVAGEIQAQTYWGSTPVEFNEAGTAHFQHQDWLGTERVRTTYTGAIESTFTSLPFGDGYSSTGADNDPYHFADLDHDYTSNTDHAQFRQYSNTQGRWMSPDPYSGSYDITNPQSFNRYSYVLNNPLSYVDQSGLACSVVVGGIRQTPGTPGTAAEHQFAASIGGIEAYPYAGGGIVGGATDVGLQGDGVNTNASYVAAAAFTAAAQNGSFNIFAFSGGAQATMNALSLVSPSVLAAVNNITFLSPGLGGGSGGNWPSGSGATTVLEGTSLVDELAAGGTFGGASTGCGHDANCAFTNNNALLQRLAGGGSGCKVQATFTPPGKFGGMQINSSNWGSAYLFLFGFGGDGSSVDTSYGTTTLDGQPVPNPN